MPATIKKLGKVASSPFGALTKSTPAKKNNKPILILIVVGGVAVIWYLRTHSSANTVGKSTTSAAVSINGGSAPDQSTIDNLTASILALQGLQTNNPTIPGGGTSTPITTTPSTTNPGSGITGYQAAFNPFVDYTAAIASLSKSDQSYYSSKVAPGTENSVPNTYNPATTLARWLDRQTRGVGGTALTQADVNIGIATATARAEQAGVTPAQLAEAKAGVANDPTGSKGYGYNDPSAVLFVNAMNALGVTSATPMSQAQTSYLNSLPGGSTVANLTALKSDPKYKALA